MQAFVETGGTGLFGRPATEMKCAGAPLKYTFLTDDRLRDAGNRGKAELVYNAHNKTAFGVPVVDEKVREIFAERGIAMNESHVLTAIDPGKRVAVYATLDGPKETAYDFIHVIPPMHAQRCVIHRSHGEMGHSRPMAGLRSTRPACSTAAIRTCSASAM